MNVVETVEPYKQEYTFLGIALAGCYARAKSQWGECSITIYDSRLFSYLGNLVDGGTVIDKRTCRPEDVVKGVVSGPMLKESLPPGHMDGLWGEGPIKCTDLSACKSMDYIALDLYLKYWGDLGARFGTRKGDWIYWNDGQTQPIPPIESRWLQER